MEIKTTRKQRRELWREIKKELEFSDLGMDGLCSILDSVEHYSLWAEDDDNLMVIAALDKAINDALLDDKGERISFWLPRALLNMRMCFDIPLYIQEKIRIRWMNHWVETGEALTYKTFNMELPKF